MEDYTRKEEGCPKLLDLIPKHREWVPKTAEETNHGLSEEKKLELRLGPPGEADWTMKASRERSHDSLSSFNYFTPWKQQFLQIPVTKESSQPCSNRAEPQSAAEKQKAFSPAPANPAVPNSAQKRNAPSPVVGWPPIRSFRKNIANGGSSSKPSSDSQGPARTKNCSPKPAEIVSRSPFVKINMDGIPIGRKVDLKAYDSYEKLSLAVDELFRGLLAAQSERCGMRDGKDEGGKGIGGLLDGSGEYTLVYEDNEGDRMLVGDVPWDMFVSTVKRLRVLKSSELPALSRAGRQGKVSVKA